MELGRRTFGGLVRENLTMTRIERLDILSQRCARTRPHHA